MTYEAAGKILISTVKNTSSGFHKTVIFVHTDDSTGSIGVILNVPMDDNLARLWSVEIGWDFPNRIHLGGPIENRLGYILHTSDYARETTIHLNDELSYTSGKPIVYDINRGTGPQDFLLLTGYCQWDPGQLKSEIDNGYWLVADFDLQYFFQIQDQYSAWSDAINITAQKDALKMLDLVDGT